MIHKFRNLLLLLICFLYLPFRRRANKKFTNPPQKILIIQMAKLGDMVCTTPMFSAIKEAYPESVLIVIGLQMNEPILRFNPRVSRYICWGGTTLPALFHLVFTLRKEKIEFACCTAPNFHAAAVSYLAGIRTIAVPRVHDGVSPYEGRAYKLLRTLMVQVSHGMRNLALREYLRLLEVINIYNPKEDKEVFLCEEGERKVQSFYEANGVSSDDFVVAINASAGNQLKRWPEERFGLLADKLAQNYRTKVVVIGAKTDIEVARRMLDASQYAGSFINAIGMFSLAELPSLIRRFDLLIGVDSGPIYIADALGVKTVDIAGPCATNTQAPEHGVVIQNTDVECMPCSFIMNAPRCLFQDLLVFAKGILKCKIRKISSPK